MKEDRVLKDIDEYIWPKKLSDQIEGRRDYSIMVMGSLIFHSKKITSDIYCTESTKINSRWIRDLNIKEKL